MASPTIQPPSAAWKTVKGLIADTVGPMAILAAAGQSFIKSSAGAALNAARMQKALLASDGATKLAKDFEHLMGSTAAAQKQVEMLAKVAASGAFTFESLAVASKNLQVLTNGALNTEQALKKVQDTAAATGQPVDTMASSVADLYNALNSGAVSGSKFAEGVKGSASQLERMGAISQETAKQVEGLAESGAGVSTTWQIVEADMSRAAGAASELGGTIAGLKQQLATLEDSGDIEIGSKFEEGEKAGLRAAIAFAKVSAAMESANAGPWAAVIGVINSVKEAFAGLLLSVSDSAPFKVLFTTVGVLGVAAFVAMTAVTIQQSAAILAWAASTAVGAAVATGFTVALGGAVTALYAFAGAITFASAGLTVVVAAVIALGASAMVSANQVSRLSKELKELKSKNVTVNADIHSRIKTMQSAEEYEAVDKDLDNKIKDNQAVKEGADKTVEESKNSWSPFTRWGGGAAKKAQEISDEADSEIKSAQSDKKEALALADATGVLGVDKERLDIARERLKLEKQIAEAAKQRQMQSFTPASAAKYANQEVAEKEKKHKEAEFNVENERGDTRILKEATNKFKEKQNAEADNKLDVEKKVKRMSEIDADAQSFVERNLQVDPTQNTEKGQAARKKALLANNEEYQDLNNSVSNSRNETMPGKQTARFDSSVYDESRNKAQTRGGKLNAEIAKRTSILLEQRAANAELETAQKTEGPGQEGLIARAQKRVKNADDQAAGITDLDGTKVGEAGLRPKAMEKLSVQLSDAKSDGDSNKTKEELEAAKVSAQAANEAKAADDASRQAGERKLAIQKQLSTLQGVEGADGQAAETELQPEIEQLTKKEAAIRAVEAAEDNVRQAQQSKDPEKIKNANAQYDQAQINSKAAGNQAGDTVESVNQEKRGMEQILNIRKQQAAIEQAAADARRNSTMQELRLRQQIAQLNFSNATGTTGTNKAESQSEAETRIADVKKTRGKAEDAASLVESRDKLRELSKSGVKVDADGMAELDKKIAGLGFDKNTNSQDIKSAIKTADANEAGLRTEQVAANRGVSRDARMQSLAMQEKYAPNQEARMEAKGKREKEEDDATIEQKTSQYSKSMDQGVAKELATKETELERLNKKGDEAGQGRIDSLTAVGGGATGFIGSNPIDVQKQINTKTQEIAQVLAKLDDSLKKQTQQGAEVLQKLRD